MALVIGLFTFIPVALASYVLFAPETWWKPVYVRVEMEDATPVGAAAEPSAKTEAAPAPVQPHAPQPESPVAALPPLSATEPALPAHLGTGVMYQMGTKVVNLADPGGLRYLQVAIVLEFHPAMEQYLLSQNAGAEGAAPEGEAAHGEGAAKGGLAAQIDSRRPIIDDVVMTALSSKRYNDISTVKGKQVLKDELIAAVNRALGFPGVINVYFTEFVVQ